MAETRTTRASKTPDNKQVVFSASMIEDILKKQSQGFILRRHENPWFKNQDGVKRTGIHWNWSPEEIIEYAKCKADVHYFAENYCKIKLENGKTDIVPLREFQKDILDLFSNNKYSILLASRQSGKCLSFNSLVECNGKEIPIFKLLKLNELKLSFFVQAKYYIYNMIYTLENILSRSDGKNKM